MTLFTRLACALIAYAVHEYQEGHARRIDVWAQPRSLTVQDDGRGMRLDRADYVESLMGLLGSRSDVVQLHGIGLSLIASSTPSLRIESRRSGSLWTQSFSWGVADGAPLRVGSDSNRGTRITIEVAPGEADIEVDKVIARAQRWRRANPDLVLVVI